MKRSLSEFLLVAILMMLLGASAPAAAQPQKAMSNPPTMSHWQARRYLQAVVKRQEVDLELSFWTAPAQIYPENLTFAPDTIKLDVSNRHFVIDLKTLEEDVSPSHKRNARTFKSDSHQKLPPPLSQIEIFAGPKQTEADVDRDARLFATSLNFLRTFARETNSPLRDFAERAATWRAQAAKPPLPEEARGLRLAAEEAVREKQPAEALNYYEMAVERDPTWPEGWFNAALVAGELGDYDDAIEHMQNYLELVPGAADAEKARDQIVAWRYKAGQQRSTGDK